MVFGGDVKVILLSRGDDNKLRFTEKSHVAE